MSGNRNGPRDMIWTMLRGTAIAMVMFVALNLAWRGLYGVPLSRFQLGLAALALLLSPTLMSLRCLAHPEERAGRRVLLIDSLAVAFVTFGVMFAIARASSGLGAAAFNISLFVFLYMSLVVAIPATQFAVRRLTGVVLPEPGLDGMPPTWANEARTLMQSGAGHVLLGFGAIGAGLALAVAPLHWLLPAGWCGATPATESATYFVLYLLLSTHGGFPLTLRRAGTLALTGFAGGLAALLAAQAFAGCTGIVAGMGWDRNIVELIVGGPMAVLAAIAHNLLAARAAREAK